MTVANKMFFLFICAWLLLTCVATGYVAHREYQVALDNVIDVSLARMQNRPDLQLYFYRGDQSRLLQTLEDFLQKDVVSTATAYSNLGEKLAERRAEDASPQLPSLQSILSQTSETESSLIAMEQGQKLSGTGYWATLFASEPTLYLTNPIFFPFNPATEGLGFENFAEALDKPGATGSFIVIGYIQLAIDPSGIRRDIRPAVGRVFLYSLLLFVLCAIPGYLIARRASLPFTQLKQLAHQILSGDSGELVKVVESAEFNDITRVLQGVLEGTSNHKQAVDLEHKLLQLKAEERAAQLSLREQELTKATEEISAAREQLHRLANYDRLTSLPNRQLFTEQLNVLLRLCARNAKPLALLFLNLKNFHHINESLGRSAGDLLLQEIGKRLANCLRSSDMLAHYVNADNDLSISRIGGDEFAIALSQLDNIDSAGLIARRVRDRLMETMTIDGHELVVNPSIGIAVAPRNGMDAEELLRAACTAMHHTKFEEGADFLFYNEEMQGTGQDDLKLESELRKAIDRNELRLLYQPQVDTTNGSIICAEALLRWDHPEYGPVSPARFIGLAEETGLIWELGDWVLVEACRQMRAFTDQGLVLPRIAINISPQQLRPAFITRLREVLRATKLLPSALELGLSEVILMANDANVLQFLQELKETGVYLSLENFGTNHAPISYLSRHPLDEIKIDRSFVVDCDKRKDNARLVRAIVAMARSLDLHTVAEGVETEGEYRFLAENKVGIMRGYLFSKPVSAAEMQRLLLVPWHFMSQIQRMALLAETSEIE